MSKVIDGYVKARIGGWVVDIPRENLEEAYTFGQGAYLWGPIPIKDIPEEFLCDTEGYAVPEILEER